MKYLNAWLLVAAGLIVACVCEVDAAERRAATDTSSVGSTPVTGQLRRTPPPRPEARLLIRGRLIVKADVGLRAATPLIVEDRGAGGYLDVVHEGPGFEGTPVVEDIGGGRYRVTLQTSDRLPVGLYRGMFRARMCTESPCANVIAGTSTSAQYRVNVKWANPGEWETFQRNAAHTGYVPVAVRASRITKIWERDGFDPGRPTIISNGITTGNGMAFVSYRDADFVWTLSALREADGFEVWRRQFETAQLNAPSVTGARVFVATTGHETTYLWSFEAADGTPRFQSPFDFQWGNVLAPTVSNGIAYTNGGYFGGGIYAYDADDGMPLWTGFSGANDASTPAIKDGMAYYYNGDAMKIYDAFDGSVLGLIADPYDPQWSGYSYNGAPMAGSTDHVVSFSGTQYSIGRPLVNYSPASGAARWRTARRYRTQPAFMDGVIYSGSHSPKSFDAIDEATGQVLRSWVPAASDTRFYNNVVLTKNLAFVSTDRAVYAIDLATHQPVWSYRAPLGVSSVLSTAETSQIDLTAESGCAGLAYRCQSARAAP